jgi:hypothetical protein
MATAGDRHHSVASTLLPFACISPAPPGACLHSRPFVFQRSRKIYALFPSSPLPAAYHSVVRSRSTLAEHGASVHRSSGGPPFVFPTFAKIYALFSNIQAGPGILPFQGPNHRENPLKSAQSASSAFYSLPSTDNREASSRSTKGVDRQLSTAPGEGLRQN